MEIFSARGAIQPGLKILARFGPGLGLKKSHEIERKFQPGLKSRK